MKLSRVMNNFHLVEIANFSVWFSYETPIAYFDQITQNVILSENVWSQTTGKHINHIKRNYDHEQLDNYEFEKRMERDINGSDPV